MSTLDSERYSRQTLFVESLLDSHPDFNPAGDPTFSAEEREIFARVFLPDWDQHGNSYIQAFEELLAHDPVTLEKSQDLLKKFCEAHRVDWSGLIG